MTRLKIHTPYSGPGAYVREVWEAARSRHTVRSFAGTVRAFACFQGSAQTEALDSLLHAGSGAAIGRVERFRAWLIENGSSAGTVRVRLMHLRSFAALARQLGKTDWDLATIRAPRTRPMRDTSGPELAPLLARAGGGPHPTRDLAIIRLLHDHGLRRSEVGRITVPADVDIRGGSASAVYTERKRHAGERQRIELGTAASRAVAVWLTERGDAPGSLFWLDGQGIYRALKALGTTPHRLRHTGATTLAAAGVDVFSLRDWLGHSDISVAAVYVDRAKRSVKELADILGDQGDGNGQ